MHGWRRTTTARAHRRLRFLAAAVVLGLTSVLVPIRLSAAGATGPVCPPLNAGNWVGTFSGSESGTWSASFDFGEGLSGTVSVEGFFSDQPASGSVSCDQILFGDVGSTVSFAGTIAPDGNTMSGTWHSESSSGTYKGWFQLGGLNMSGYCQSLGFNGQGETPPVILSKGSNVGPNYAFDNWTCVGSESTVPVAATGPAPSMNDACASQYPSSTPYAHPSDPDDAYSWNCYPISLVTSISGSPSTVTAGADVQYVVTVQNEGLEPVVGVQVADTLPSGTTRVSASAPGWCAGTAPVTCSLGTLGPSGSAAATLVVKTAATVPSGGFITDTATATPGSNNVASRDTAVVSPTPGSASGFVPPGGSIDTGGNNPAHLSLPNTGPGATVALTQQPTGNNFCNGPCNGTATFISDFPGYSNPLHPIDLKLTFADGSSLATARNDYATSTIYKVRDNQTVGVSVPDCSDNPSWTRAQKRLAAVRRLLRVGTQSGIANPSPCVDSRTITKVGAQYKVTFEILFLSDDGGFARR
ncbi:MAG TPA: DUF11 domain-containing protein [Acidimicrobiia bacterium]